LLRIRVPIAREQPLSGSGPVLENDQYVLVYVGTAQVDFFQTGGSAFFNQSPEQKGHAAEVMGTLR